MACEHGARDNLLTPTMEWSKSMLHVYKQQLTADQMIPQKRVESKRSVRADILVKGIYHRRLIYGIEDCISMK